MLSELIELGFHDTLVNSLTFDFLNKKIIIFLNVIYSVNENDKEVNYRKGTLYFNNIKECTFDDTYDFINSNHLVILSGVIADKSCNLFLSSNQNINLEYDSVEFYWENED